ncbi:pre-mRNA-processing factor 6/Prp1/STA1, partial [Kipferlia bialata]|eukprot:g4873.t1
MEADFSRPDFNAMVPPPGYVAGIGRGASGFTTRSDVGPARMASLLNADGSETSQTVGAEQEREIAEQVYDAVGSRVSEKGAKRRHAQEKEIKQKGKRGRVGGGSVSSLYQDVKRGLDEMDNSAWETIPEARDFTRQKKAERERQRKEFREFRAAPDHLLAERLSDATVTSISSGSATSGGSRTDIMANSLDRAGESTKIGTRTSALDVAGYMTALENVPTFSHDDLQNQARIRKTLRSLIETNPQQASGYVQLARLELHGGKPRKAREILLQ